MIRASTDWMGMPTTMMIMLFRKAFQNRPSENRSP